jgi:hypothetical protein
LRNQAESRTIVIGHAKGTIGRRDLFDAHGKLLAKSLRSQYHVDRAQSRIRCTWLCESIVDAYRPTMGPRRLCAVLTAACKGWPYLSSGMRYHCKYKALKSRIRKLKDLRQLELTK